MPGGESSIYQIDLTRAAVKDLKKIPKDRLARIDQRILGLAAEPYPSGAKRLTSKDALVRIRVGDYRVIYQVDTIQKIVTIARVRIRGEAYENL